MTKLENLIHRLNQLNAPGQDQHEFNDAAEDLWEYPSYEKEITDDQLRDAYVLALFIVARLFSHEKAIIVLKRAYSLDRGHYDFATKGSAKEFAAYSIGVLYESLRSYHSAIWWFRRSLNLAHVTGVRDNTLLNLGALGRNLEFLAHYEEAGQYYNQMLEMQSSIPLSNQNPLWFIPPAMYHILHGDQARGEILMRKWIAVNLEKPHSNQIPHEPLEAWAYEALHYLGMHYIATGRPQEAIQLAEKMKPYRPAWVDEKTDLRHVLIARAFLHLGQLDHALIELAQVYDVDSPQFTTAKSGEVDIFELWIDIARIHVAKHNYDKAIAAYVVLSYSFGALIADPGHAPGSRLRFYWLQQMVFVVHEMVSVWISIADIQVRQKHEATVGNLLLQLKGNLFIALAFHKGPFMSLKEELFIAARKFGIAARKVINKPEDTEALIELEQALREREDVEGSLLTAEINPSAALSAIFTRDFRESYMLTNDSLLLDYSLITYQPPRNGLAGPFQALRYIGVRVTKGSLRVVDLGEAKMIETLCDPLAKALSRQPTEDDNTRGIRLPNWRQPNAEINLHELTNTVYDRIVAPFEPLTRSLLFSADGILAAIPFHALIHEDRYLVEDRDISYCYSLLQREALYMRQISSSTAARPPIIKSALLLGDPNYTLSNLIRLEGTKIEVRKVAKLLKSEISKGSNNALDEVRVYTGADAIVSQLLGVSLPRILHIAAHGGFDENQARLFTSQPIRFGGFYRRWQQITASPMNELDNALLHSTIMLAEDPEGIEDPAHGMVLTALELASLNLVHCDVIVLSACETGAGLPESGAGVLGFQYAIMASCAKAGLLSLWKVLDKETSDFMIDFYQNFLNHRSTKAGYLDTLRKHCRKNGQLVHPYYWAAFVFLDQEYF